MAYVRWSLWWHLYVALGSHGGQWCMHRRSCRDNAAYDVTVPDKWGINTVRLFKLPSLAATARCSAVVATFMPLCCCDPRRGRCIVGYMRSILDLVHKKTLLPLVQAPAHPSSGGGGTLCESATSYYPRILRRHTSATYHQHTVQAAPRCFGVHDLSSTFY